MQYLTDLCEMKIVKTGDVIPVPSFGQKFEIEVVSFEPSSEPAVQVRKWTQFRVLKKDSNEIDHFFDPDPEQEIRKLLGVRDSKNTFVATKKTANRDSVS